MIGYLHIDGAVTAKVSGSPESLDRMAALNGVSLALEVESGAVEAAQLEDLFVKNGFVKIKPARPSLDHVWDNAAAEWANTLTPEIEWQRADEAARQERDRLLRDSDWTQLLDVPVTGKLRADWAAYRQALRDIPQQAGYPLSIVWPNRPEEA